MTRRRWIGVSLSVLFVVTTITINSAFTASNSVAVSGAGLFAQSIDANALKPATCGGLNLTSIVAGDGDLSGSNSGDLIVGGPSAQSISGAGGNDCILGGAGDDVHHCLSVVRGGSDVQKYQLISPFLVIERG